ncbi:hypothetical protein LR48_Vigan148s002000 [Vigna angularis]|uniref:Putative plant transposon protein domain-containing protein n=1 Tax=Phaseolus angularis TaxID=3914 RepID=A0A0L9T5N6_PHAAN|nr:hypothetical protein LR48_Vigan148s002000 [Vigna angularis]
MASTSGKRIKTIGSKSKDKKPEHSYANKFLSRKHKRHFKVVQDRRLLTERKVGLIPDLAPQFGEQLENRNWGRLATYPTPANIAVVKEFYTNVRRLGDHPAEDYLSYVRGHAIRYDPDSSNRFLNTEWAGEQCQFALNMEEGVDFGDVESVLRVPGGHFQRNRSGVVVNIRRVDLTPLAKYWMEFSHANIQPCSHLLDITINRTLLLYYVFRGLSINVGQVIANDIQLAGVNISAPPFERPRKAIDEAYYRHYCGGDEAAQLVPPRRPRRARGPSQSQASGEPHEAESFQMRDMYMSLIDAQMQSIHRGQVATVEMIIGMYDTPPTHRWTMDEFHNVVAWPEEQVHGSGAGAAGPSTMEDDDDDHEFEDVEEVEDDEEEED